MDPQIEKLDITEPEKRILESFLETECSPTSELSPSKARKMREKIIEEVEEAAESYPEKGGASRGLYQLAKYDATIDEHTKYLLRQLAYSFQAVR